MIDGMLVVTDGILTIWKLKASLLSNIVWINFALSKEISKSIKVA